MTIKRKICVITGTRAEYGLLKPVMNEIKKSSILSLFLVVAGMHLDKKYGNTFELINNDDFKISYKVKMNPESDAVETMAKSVGAGILGMVKAFKVIKPDVVLILGDRIEVLSAAIAAAYMNIVVAHIHGGDISKGLDESARHAITKFAHLHFAASRQSQKRIFMMGERPECIFLTGAPGLDSILNDEYVSRESLYKQYGIAVGQPFILLLQHPVTTQIAQAGKQMRLTLAAIKKLGMPTILIYPNSDAGGRKMIEVIERNKQLLFLKIFKNLPHNAYLGLLRHAAVLVGNSSSGIIEAASYKLPVVNVGIRQEGRERSVNVIDVDHDEQAIVKAIRKAMHDNKYRLKLRRCKSPYGDGHASERIVKVLESVRIDQSLLQKQINY